jgi:hypothetical protein
MMLWATEKTTTAIWFETLPRITEQNSLAHQSVGVPFFSKEHAKTDANSFCRQEGNTHAH